MSSRKAATTLFCAMAMATTSRSWKPPTPTSVRRISIIRPQASSSSSRISNNNVRLFSAASKDNNNNNNNNIAFQRGDKIQVEVIAFGPLGASVEVIAHGSHDEADLLPESAPPLAKGLILQKEIAYFRQARNHVDVVRGEILPAYIERIRAEQDDDDDNEDDNNGVVRLDVCLRAFGGKAKTVEVAQQLLDRLEFAPNGVLELGDKSSPAEIAREFPGVSKGSFKKAVGALYRQGKIEPEATRIRLVVPKEKAT